MKKLSFMLSVLFLVLISTQSYSERWDGATVDMSGSNSGSSSLCDQPRPTFDPGKAAMWDGLCGNRNTPTPEPSDQEAYIPEDNPQPDNFDWDEWQREFDNGWENPSDNRAARERYNREVRDWANQFSYWVIYSMPTFFNYHPDVAANLPALRNDLYNPILRGQIQQCLAYRVANDTENVRNLMNLGDQDRLIGYHVMAINNCYHRLR